jgi:hypothetical protein
MDHQIPTYFGAGAKDWEHHTNELISSINAPISINQPHEKLAGNFSYTAPTKFPSNSWYMKARNFQAQAQVKEAQRIEEQHLNAQCKENLTNWLNSQDTNNGEEILCRLIAHLESEEKLRVRYGSYIVLRSGEESTILREVWEILDGIDNGGEKKFTTILKKFGDDLNEIMEEMEERLDTLYSASSVDHTQNLAPPFPRHRSPVNLDEFFSPTQASDGTKVDEHVANWARSLIEEVYLISEKIEEVAYSVVNIEEDLIQKVYILPIEEEEVGAILHGKYQFDEHLGGAKGENKPHPHIWEYERGVD